MQQKHLSFLYCSFFALSLFTLLSSCHHGVTIHPSKLTPEMQKECATALSGLYDTRVHVVSTIGDAERIVKIENGKRVEYFESQDSTLQLKATVLGYDNGMKMILHDFPLSTMATALPDSLSELRTAIAAQPDQELTVGYQFRYNGDIDQLYLVFSPQDVPFTCQTADGRQHHLRLCFTSSSNWQIGSLEDRIMNINLILNKRKFSFSATTLYEDEQPLFTFDEWKSNDFYDVVVSFNERM